MHIDIFDYDEVKSGTQVKIIDLGLAKKIV